MKTASIKAVFRCLHEAGVRYIVVGGLAVIEHGFLRQTKDIDLVIDLEPANIVQGLEALQSLGYCPRVPVTPSQFADATMRETWIREKGMLVLNLFSDSHIETPIDVFVRHPFDFAAELKQGLVEIIDETIPVHFVSLETLLRLKEEAGRPHDLIDIEHLRLRSEEP
jgi:predicted nucleotidyltransferase